MATATFKKDDLLALLDGEDCEALEKVQGRITGTSRWSVNHALVFKDKASGKFYEVGYSVGATEQQDESPFEYEPDDVSCEEVHPVQKTVTVYERTPTAEASPA